MMENNKEHENRDNARPLSFEREKVLSEDKDALAKEVVELKNHISSIKLQQSKLLNNFKFFKFTFENELKNVERIQKFILNAEKRINNFIREETRKVLDETGIKKIINKYLYDILNKDEIVELVKSVASNVIDRINKKLMQELKTTKSLCYSIDMEIKHTIRDLPVSYNTEQIIIKKINDTIVMHIEKKLEHKKIPKLPMSDNK